MGLQSLSHHLGAGVGLRPMAYGCGFAARLRIVTSLPW